MDTDKSIEKLESELYFAKDEYFRRLKPAEDARKRYEKAKEMYHEALRYEKAKRQVIMDLIKASGDTSALLPPSAS